MSQDIDHALEDWPYQAGMVQARTVTGKDGRPLLQLRVDLGILQMETGGRPDGARPQGFPTYFAFLKDKARKKEKFGENYVLGEEECQEADREFVQFYHRRLCWLALRQYERAMADAAHTLAFMDFVRDHSPGEEYTQSHEQYRGFVLYQKTQAAAALEVERKKPEAAVDALRAGLEEIRRFFAEHNIEEHMEEDGMVRHLRQIEETLRKEYNIEATLQEQLDKAVANEEYEKAARLRDALRRQQLEFPQ